MTTDKVVVMLPEGTELIWRPYSQYS